MRTVGGLLGLAWVLMGVLVVVLIVAGSASTEDWERLDRLARQVGR